MSPIRAPQGREGDQLAVGREVRRLRRVDVASSMRCSILPRDDVLRRSATRASRCARSRRADRRPATTTSTAPSSSGRRAWRCTRSPLVLVEAARQVADDRAVLRRDQDDVELAVAAVAGHRGDQVARRRRLDRTARSRTRVFCGIGREVAAVVGRPLLVAERLEAVLQVLLELLVELLGVELEALPRRRRRRRRSPLLRSAKRYCRTPSLPHFDSMNSNTACPRL